MLIIFVKNPKLNLHFLTLYLQTFFVLFSLRFREQVLNIYRVKNKYINNKVTGLNILSHLRPNLCLASVLLASPNYTFSFVQYILLTNKEQRPIGL